MNWSLYLFIFLGLFSPGPNVILLTASGARFGFRRTLPHVAGVVVGVGITAGLTGLGIGALLIAAPQLRMTLQILAAVWIIYMAYRLWQSTRTNQSRTDRPFTMQEAILFQWVNPKIWAVAVAAVAYIPEASAWMAGLLLGTGFSGINLLVCLFWTCTGALLSWLLTTPKAYRAFMRTMACLLAISAMLIFV